MIVEMVGGPADGQSREVGKRLWHYYLHGDRTTLAGVYVYERDDETEPTMRLVRSAHAKHRDRPGVQLIHYHYG